MCKISGCVPRLCGMCSSFVWGVFVDQPAPPSPWTPLLLMDHPPQDRLFRRTAPNFAFFSTCRRKFRSFLSKKEKTKNYRKRHCLDDGVRAKCLKFSLTFCHRCEILDDFCRQEHFTRDFLMHLAHVFAPHFGSRCLSAHFTPSTCHPRCHMFERAFVVSSCLSLSCFSPSSTFSLSQSTCSLSSTPSSMSSPPRVKTTALTHY